ncbi:MAG: KH domain-containing protein [Deltaproteobacteria bacterium]|nr:KH domain-containing protein [Deltaproteobacteria bacterium]
MDFVETEGDTIDQAIENALKQLGVARDKITVEVLSEGKKGILGFGAQKARVRAALRKPAAVESPAAEVKAPPPLRSETAATPVDLAPVVDLDAITARAKTVLVDILSLMGLQASVETLRNEKQGETILEIRTESSGLLIGRKGQTLEALQYLVSRIASEKPSPEIPHLVIDIENYRQRRRATLEDMALRLGEKAKRQRKTVSVDALSAADRRVIHAALQDDPWLTTKSLGQGSYRRLLIIPEGDRRTKDEPAPAPTIADKQGHKAAK